MRVLGIDPGSRVMGWGLVEERAGRLVQIAAGVAAPQGELAIRLAHVAACVDDLIERFTPEMIAIERAFVGKSVASALRLGEARGALYAVAGRRGLRVVDYAPATVKVAVAGSGQAEKSMVARGVQQLLGGTRVAGDEADALAVAICHLRHSAFASRLRPAVEPAPAGVRRTRTSVPREAAAREIAPRGDAGPAGARGFAAGAASLLEGERGARKRASGVASAAAPAAISATLVRKILRGRSRRSGLRG